MVRTSSAFVVALAIVLMTATQSSAQFTNGGFESGSFAGWGTTDYAAPFYPLTIATAGSDNSFGWPWSSTPTEGTFAAYHGFDGGGPDTLRIFQDVFVSGTTLEFDHRHAWDKTFGATLPRTFDVNVEVAGGGANLLSTTILTAAPGTTVLDTGPASSALDVSAFTGSSVRISFDWFLPEVNTGPAAAQLDNVRFTGVVPEPSSVTLLALCTFAIFRRRR